MAEKYINYKKEYSSAKFSNFQDGRWSRRKLKKQNQEPTMRLKASIWINGYFQFLKAEGLERKKYKMSIEYFFLQLINRIPIRVGELKIET